MLRSIIMSEIGDLSNPRQIILITSRHKTKDNIMACAWHMPLSFIPIYYAVAVGKLRYSYHLIHASGRLVVNFMSAKNKDQIMKCGQTTGKKVDKFKLTGLHKIELAGFDCPYIKEAQGYIACKVEKEVEAGDHVVFVGKAVTQKIFTKAPRLFHAGGEETVALGQ